MVEIGTNEVTGGAEASKAPGEGTEVVRWLGAIVSQLQGMVIWISWI